RKVRNDESCAAAGCGKARHAQTSASTAAGAADARRARRRKSGRGMVEPAINRPPGTATPRAPLAPRQQPAAKLLRSDASARLYSNRRSPWTEHKAESPR